MSYNPERGDVVWLDFHPNAGGETRERRPGLVLSRRDFNVATGFMLVCPISNSVKGSPFEVAMPPGSAATGVVIVSEVRSLDWLARRAEKKGTAPAHLVHAVVEIAKAILDD